MGLIHAFLLFAVLIGGSALVVDEANGEEMPDVVELFYTESVVTTIGGAGISEYLRPTIQHEQLSTEITIRIDCYSDGSGELLVPNGGQELVSWVESGSLDQVRDILLAAAYMVCGHQWEKKYGDSDPRESEPAWYF